MLRFVEIRGIRTDKTPPARTEVLSARGEESKPSPTPAGGPVANALSIGFFKNRVQENHRGFLRNSRIESRACCLDQPRNTRTTRKVVSPSASDAGFVRLLDSAFVRPKSHSAND